MGSTTSFIQFGYPESDMRIRATAKEIVVPNLKIRGTFAKYDANGDQKIEKAEVMTVFKDEKAVNTLFDKFDTDKNGFITLDELAKGLEEVKGSDADDLLFEFLTKIQKQQVMDEMAEFQVQGHKVEVSWAEGVSYLNVRAATQTRPFQRWLKNLNQIKNTDPKKPDLFVNKIHIQNIDMFGPRVGFIKFQCFASSWNEKEKKVADVPGVIFMRGGAAGILTILKEDTKEGKEWAVVTIQPRLPAGSDAFVEIPAGMLDDATKGKFAGKAADELREETLLEIKEEELINLTEFAYGTRFPGMFPSAGGCDEFLVLYAYRRIFSPEVIKALQNAHGGDGDHEIIKVRLVPLEDLYKEAPDAKALSALCLYDIWQKKNPKAAYLPADKAAEAKLLAKLKK
eukprot:TRINITY_DN2545_c0_g1_i1.p1 TRINITY_DN2545_c0_g1~~TRINITY_DN2545_c0_g1_i1.p1  ORF type:complete len:447 (-),score=126.34 TRINITY_DN2545_c0_g1_i1:49-1242(-)